MNMIVEKLEKEKKEYKASIMIPESFRYFVKEYAKRNKISFSKAFRMLNYNAYADCIENKRISRNRNNFYVECGEFEVIYNK